MVKPLWNHQIESIRLAQTRPDFFLAMEQGTGKTRSTIEILRRRYAHEGRLMKTLVISPIIVCDNWRKEILQFSKIQDRDIVVLTDSGKRRCIDLVKATGENLARAKIIITNYQGMLINDFYKLLFAWKPEILVCDESHRAKSHTSKTAKKIAVLADNAKQRLLLTGTPILNSPADLWMQFRILDGGETFGKNFFAFRHQYFKDDNAAWANRETHFAKWVPQMGAYERIQSKIQPKVYRVLKKDCLDLPPLVRQDVEIGLGKDQARMYEEMKKEFIAFVKDQEGKHPQTVTAQLAVTKALRLQQILSGYCNTEQDSIVRIKDNPRLDALEELLTDIAPNHKIIVWAVFKENYKMIKELCDRLKFGYAEIHGDINNARRIEEMDRFRKDPDCRIMVANQSAGGAGINLVEASYAIYYSKGFSLEHDLQSEARNHRGGSEIHEKVTRIDLIAKGTIDELISDALKKKQQISDVILTWRI